MNRRQRATLVAMMVSVALMLLYPPFARGPADWRSVGFHFLLAPPRGASVDVRLLLTEWLGVLILGGLAYFLFKD